MRLYFRAKIKKLVNEKVETQDEYKTLKEAKQDLKEYKMISNNYYLSTRCSKDWRESKND